MCGRTCGGVVRCWGLNDHGELGDGTPESSNQPVFTLLNYPADDLTVSGYGACALLSNGETVCWGLQTNEHLGIDGAQEIFTPSFPTVTRT